MLTVTANVSGIVAEIGDIYIGAKKLTLDTDYTINDNEITLVKTEELSNLTEGKHIIKIETDVNDLFVELTVVDTEEEE